jgi:hypothetical protein
MVNLSDLPALNNKSVTFELSILNCSSRAFLNSFDALILAASSGLTLLPHPSMTGFNSKKLLQLDAVEMKVHVAFVLKKLSTFYLKHQELSSSSDIILDKSHSSIKRIRVHILDC